MSNKKILTLTLISNILQKCELKKAGYVKMIPDKMF